MSNIDEQIKAIVADVKEKDADQQEFLQAVEEVAFSLKPVFEKGPKYLHVFRILCEPDRVIQFRVNWQDDKGQMQTNRAWRVQFNQAIGPYKGGLRFREGLKLGVLKFLGFEQILKNALTTLPMGGGKGGSDFDPKGKSDGEVLRFCQALMTELSRYIGPHVDVPAGDIGVGAREIGYLYGQYKRVVGANEGVLTGKGANWGGSLIRPEATGYGVVYMLRDALDDTRSESLEGKACLVSGSGNVAQYAAEKLLEFKAKVMTLSDSKGVVYFKDGLTSELLKRIMELKNAKRGRLSEAADWDGVEYHDGKKPWSFKADIAIPCATQNEIDDSEASSLASNGVTVVVEGANMPSTNEAVQVYKQKKFLYLPAKAANAGGVAVSGLEMSQNAQGLSWTREEVDEKLKSIMNTIYTNIRDTAKELGSAGDLQLGANAHGFLKVADSMIDEGYALPQAML